MRTVRVDQREPLGAQRVERAPVTLAELRKLLAREPAQQRCLTGGERGVGGVDHVLTSGVTSSSGAGTPRMVSAPRLVAASALWLAIVGRLPRVQSRR